MLEKLNAEDMVKFSKVSPEEKEERGILGRLSGPIASCVVPTRNGRQYSDKLWENVFKSDLVNELFENGGLPGELDHPADRSETDTSRIAVMMPNPPKKDKKGRLIASLDIVNTPCGQIAYQLAKYGFKFGISSRGEGDFTEDYEGNQIVDPNTYELKAFDLVLLPACKDARLTMTESLNTKKYNKTLKESLQKMINEASEEDKKVMEDALKDLDIDLEEQQKLKHTLREDDEVNAFMDVMASNDELQEEPSVGIFWYDKDKNDLFGVVSALAQDVPYYSNNMFDSKVRTCRALHKNIWNKENKRNKDPRFSGDYTQVPRGRVFEVENKGFVVMVGDWIEKYPEAKEEILAEFNLPEDTEFKMDDHWNLGHGWSEEGFLEEDMEDEKLPKEEEASTEVSLEEIPEEDKKKECDCECNHDEDGLESSEKEPLDIKADEIVGEVTEVADDESDDEMVEQFQELLKAKKTLEEKLMDLQNKLAVSDAKVNGLNEELNKYKNATVLLSNKANELKESQTKVAKLQEALKQKNDLLKKSKDKLTESVKAKDNVKLLNEKLKTSYDKLKTSNEEIEKLNSQLTDMKADYDLKESLSEKKLTRAKTLIRDYKQLANDTMNRYIESKANMIGVNPNEIKNKLDEKYTVNDVDKICESLTSYKVNLSRLPINISNNVKVKVKESVNESLSIKSPYDDTVDDDLLTLAKL